MLTSLRQVQALAHPLRFRAFERLIDAPWTGKQLAEALGKQATHLYHHLGVLERAGLVRQVSTNRKRGTVEKYYRAVCDRVVVDKALFGRKIAANQALVGQVLRVTFDEFVEAQSFVYDVAPAPPRILKRLRIRAPRRRIQQLYRRLEDWLKQFEAASDPQCDSEQAVTVAFYPVKVTNPAQLAMTPHAQASGPTRASAPRRTIQ